MSPFKRQKKDWTVWIAGIIYFIGIPLLLVILFLLSDMVKELLLLYPTNPTFLSVIGSHYLHTTLPHLASNLTFYFLVLPFIFMFDRMSNRKMPLVNLVLLFIILPILVSLINTAIFSDVGITAPGKGFSAIAAGLFGYLAFSTLHFIRDYHGVRFERSIFQLMWLILYINLALISLTYGYYLMVLLLCLLILISIFLTYKDYGKILDLLTHVNRVHRTAIFGGFTLSLIAAAQGLFPETTMYGTTLINIAAHYVGYIFGFVGPAVVSTYVIEKER